MGPTTRWIRVSWAEPQLVDYSVIGTPYRLGVQTKSSLLKAVQRQITACLEDCGPLSVSTSVSLHFPSFPFISLHFPSFPFSPASVEPDSSLFVSKCETVQLKLKIVAANKQTRSPIYRRNLTFTTLYMTRTK